MQGNANRFRDAEACEAAAAEHCIRSERLVQQMDSQAAPDAGMSDDGAGTVSVSGRRQLAQLATPRIVGGTQTNAVR